MNAKTQPSRADKTPRQRLGVEVRQVAILDAAEAEFSQNSYVEVKVSDVAARAQASPALVFRYFDSKSGLYVAVLQRAIGKLLDDQKRAVKCLGKYASARERVRAALEVYLDFVANNPVGWVNPLSAGEEPAEVRQVWTDTLAQYRQMLRDILQPSNLHRHDYALWGYFGFISQACATWVLAGCPEGHRGGLIEACLGALEGALGDWGK